MNDENRHAYWRANKALIRNLLIAWGIVSIGCSILFVQPLNLIPLGGLPFGVWIAQPGSILSVGVIHSSQLRSKIEPRNPVFSHRFNGVDWI